MIEEKKFIVEIFICINRFGSLKCVVDLISLNICLFYNEMCIIIDLVLVSWNVSYENINLYGNRKYNVNIVLIDKKVNGKFYL